MFKILLAFVLLGSFALNADSAPHGPGGMGRWSPANKDAFLGTYSSQSKVWATIAQGILTETYFPTLDRANSRDTQLIFVSNYRLYEERKHFTYKVTRHPGTLSFHVTSQNSETGIKIEKDIVLDPERASVVVHYQLHIPDPTQTQVYVLHNPAADNTAGGDEVQIMEQKGKDLEVRTFQSHWNQDERSALFHRAFQVLKLTQPVRSATVGFEGVNGPWDQLSKRLSFFEIYQRASMGNVAAGLELDQIQSKMNFSLALGFSQETQVRFEAASENAGRSLAQGAFDLLQKNKTDWGRYLSKLNLLGKNNEPHVLVLKAMEDKSHLGAIIAAPSLPAIPESIEASEYYYEDARRRWGDANGGYHRVWPRDLFHMALGLLAAGDTETPKSILDYYKQIQLSDGTFPQNTWVDGTMSWSGFQIDQTGFPISLVARLKNLGLIEYDSYRPMVLRAARALVKKGPWTGQERWEEVGGLSPNSIAVACQGLVDAAWLESDEALKKEFSQTCENWKSQIYDWTFVNEGPMGRGYFERMELGGNNPVDPGFGSIIKIANEPASGQFFKETEIMDGGFLQWILSGLVDALEPRFSSSIRVYDEKVRGETPFGLGYLRYNHDGYGMDHVGVAWPLLSSERALAAIERKEDPRLHVQVLMKSVTSADMLCEQVGPSACPLGWAHASVLILQRSLQDSKSFYRR